MNTNGIETVLCFDTETTGRANFNLPGHHPDQPLPVQLGALMYYIPEGVEFTFDAAKEVHRANVIIDQPLDIAPGAVNVHGISKDLALNTGITLETAVFLFDDMVQQADLIVAHNMKFDIRVMERAYAETGHHGGLWPGVAVKQTFCTMQVATPILNIPKPNGWRGPKWPSLEEASRMFLNESVEGAHDALVDVEACAKVFFHLVNLLTTER